MLISPKSVLKVVAEYESHTCTGVWERHVGIWVVEPIDKTQKKKKKRKKKAFGKEMANNWWWDFFIYPTSPLLICVEKSFFIPFFIPCL